LGVEHPAHLFANVLVDKTPLAGATTGGHVPGDLSLISGDRKGIRELWAKPFVWRDPKGIPPRRWLYQPHFIRGYVTVTVAVGGAGKTALTMCEGLSVAAGKPLLRIEPSERARVWMWNGEDPGEEGEKRVHAALIQHGLNARDIEGWLSTGSGRDAELVIAEQGRDGARVSAPEVDALIAMILEREIGLVVIDPFVSSHRVPENDNGGIDRVVKAWARIAQETGCAVHLVHHVRKTNGHEATVEDGRGASALHAAARHVRVLNVMGEAEAARVGVDQMKRRSYVRIDDGKTNLTPPAAAAEWFRLVGVELGNGDNVQTVVRWTPPDPFQALLPEDLQRVQDAIARGYGETAEGWRENVQAGDRWAGHAVAGALGFDVSQAHDHSQVKEVIREMIASGLLVKVTRPINGKGKTAPFIEVGRRGLTPHLGQVGGGKVEKVAETA
jgi:hypothetical protein